MFSVFLFTLIEHKPLKSVNLPDTTQNSSYLVWTKGEKSNVYFVYLALKHMNVYYSYSLNSGFKAQNLYILHSSIWAKMLILAFFAPTCN